jgi:hypothetical protein
MLPALAFQNTMIGDLEAAALFVFFNKKLNG